ncbi:hypothetical protein HQ571_06225 [Candidatus Kuenenbacteria bacterium]|nr:hypothetical protein [Candidatus Kuenenbacteria bacterium]
MPNNIYNNLSDQDLKRSYWYVTHRVILRKVGILALTIVSGGLFLFGVGGLVNHYLIGYSDQVALEKDITGAKLNYSLLAELNTPQNLQILETKVLNSGQGYYDLISEVVNPNSTWTVEEFDFYYLIGEEQTNLKSDFILPGQNKFVMYLNYARDKNFNAANLVIENIKWKKVSDFQALQQKIMQFDYQNMAIVSSQDGDLSDKGQVAQVSFDVLNKSSYNFWEPRFVVLIKKRDILVGVTQTILNGLNSGEKKSHSINLFQNIPRVVTMEIFPDINILDPNIFKGFGLEPGEAK